MASKFRLSPVIASQFPQRLEGQDREKQKERVTSRGRVIKDSEKIQKQGTGPPTKSKGPDKKNVTFSDSTEEMARQAERREDSVAKPKSLPFVDVPPLKASVRKPINDLVEEDQMAKFGPSYKSVAPVEIGIDIERLVKQVLDLEISVPLRNLAGVSGAVQKEIKKQVTKSRVPVEIDETPAVLKRSKPTIRLKDLPVAMYTISTAAEEEVPEGSLIAGDPILQYLSENKGIDPEDLIVAAESVPLRAIYMSINRVGQEECLLDGGSMIVSMSKETAVRCGLSWDPSLRFNMESASNHVEKTLGLARNVRFAMGGIAVFLQVHILANPPYRVLLGRPFETITGCDAKNHMNGSSELTLTDPNTKKTAVLPTYERGVGPEELQKQHYQDF
jgi:hypothetical protein